MRLLRFGLLACAVLAVGAYAQGTYTKVVPNLICAGDSARISELYRPEVINLDGVTIRDILTFNHYSATQPLIVQVIRVKKETPYLKCTAFVTGPGAGLNTNFDSGLKKATNADLDKDIVNLAFGIPQGTVALGNRALLFSPPGTTYTLSVTFVILDGNGRPGVPITVNYVVVVQVPTRDDLQCNVDYFATVAAGATQKPKIDNLAYSDLVTAIWLQDDLTALIAIETAIATYAIDFTDLLKRGDVRFYHDYLIDDSEEPIGCLLVEMANAALWH
jgi:hypothetical protein